MGKVTRRSSTDREETTKQPRRKRRRKDLDRMHSKILQAKRKLDNVGKDGNKVGQKRQIKARICNRLLPGPAAGIYRNGAKGKDVQKAETSENMFRNARLKADALKLFNGDTHGSKCIVEIPSCDKTTKQSSNKDCMKQSLGWTLEQSPVLGKRLNQNQKPCLIKKKGEENIFEDTDSNKLKQNVNNKPRHSQKEDMYICKRRLFQNDREQLETITATSTTQIFDNTDFTKENEENETEQMCSKNSKASACSPLSCYMEFCKIISAENFEKDILPNYDADPLTTTIKRLRHVYTNSFRKQLLRKKKQELGNMELTYSVEYQACTSSDISQFSPVEFEVPKCSENHTIAHLQKGPSSQKNDKFHLMQNAELKKSDDKTRYSSTSYSSQNFATYSTYSPVMENCENNDTQRSKQSKDIRQLSKSTSCYFINDKDSIQLDSQKNSNYVSRLSKNRRQDFSIDILDHGNSRCIDLGTSMFLSNSILSKRYFTKDYSREKLSITVSDNCTSNNVSQKCNNRTTNKCNVKNVKRIPTILRRYNIINNKPNCPVQTAGDHAELYKTAFPNVMKNLSTSSTNAIFDQTKILGPQIGSMKIKDSQESQVEQFDINMHLKEHNGRNEFYRYDGSLPRTFETSYNTNAYSKKLPQQEQQISSDIRDHFFHSNNHRPINYLRSVSFPNSNVESKKVFPQQTELHMCETSKQSLFRKDTRNQNQNILFNNVNDRAIPSPILNFPQNIQTKKRSTESYQEMFDKTDLECAKNQINRHACHCNEQYIYLHSANCPRKYKRQTHYFRETAQPESLCDTRDYNNSIDNCVNVSDTMQNVPLLSLEQKNNLYTYPKAIDDQHRTVLLRDVTQPVKYLAVKSGSDIQRIPVYINDRSVRVAENVPLKVIALMEPSAQTKAFSQEIATHVIPLQTDSSHFNDFATRKISDQSFVKHFDSMNAIVLNPNSQSNIWYTSNL